MGIPIHPAHLPQPLMPQCPPQHRLQGQKALVTGAGSGIGRAIALALGQAGADISLEAPISGMSMNPARSLASAFPAGLWSDLWIYFIAPVLGMQAAAAWYAYRRGLRAVTCAKLQHPLDQRCIHCGHSPSPTGEAISKTPEVLR